MTVKERVRRLVDDLPESELYAAERYLQYLRDTGVSRTAVPAFLHDAPEDDEPYTAEEQAAVREGYEDLESGRTTSLAELRRDLDL